MKQSQLDNFFKIKTIIKSEGSSKKAVTKNRLKLKKSPKPKLEAHSDSEVVNLISDDENQDVEINCSATSTKSNISGVSDSTIVYSVEKKPSPGAFSTPSPKKKFFSPNKKRGLPIKSPIKAKRNLNMSLGSEEIKDEEFAEITKGLDDNSK